MDSSIPFIALLISTFIVIFYRFKNLWETRKMYASLIEDEVDQHVSDGGKLVELTPEKVVKLTQCIHNTVNISDKRWKTMCKDVLNKTTAKTALINSH